MPMRRTTSGVAPVGVLGDQLSDDRSEL